MGADSAPTPASSWVAEIVAELDRLGLPATTGFGTAQDALCAAGRGVGTDRLRAALKARKQRDGVTPLVRSRAAVPSPPELRRVPLAALFAAMVDGRLVGAACTGRHDLFDAELDEFRETAAQRDTRHAAAVAICDACPVLETCRTVADETGRQARGVWAGTVRNISRPAGRTRKESVG